MHRAIHAATPATQASRVNTTHTYSHLMRVFTPPHHGADDQVAAAPAGGRRGRRPMRAPAPKTDDVAASARGPPSALRGRAPAASLREGDRRSVRFWPLWHRGSRRRASTATKLQDNGFFGSLKQSRAAELGRAADPPRVPRDQNGRGSMYSHQDRKTPASGSTRGYGSQKRYGRFTRQVILPAGVSTPPAQP